MSIAINGKSTDKNFITQLSSRGLELTVDEPLDKGGLDTAFAPMELIGASLSSCTIITLQMYFNHKGWKYETIEVDVEFDQTINPFQIFRSIKVTANLDEKQFARIEKIANACPVHKLLEKGNEIITSVELV